MRKQGYSSSRRTLAACAMAFASLTFAACTTTTPNDTASAAEQRSQINAGVNSTLSRLYSAAPGSQTLIQQSKGVLVFPSVMSASFIVGGEYGKGALRVKGVTQGYYSLGGGSIGFQAGAQSRAIVLVFTTQQALESFLSSNGWAVGADANVALATLGANGSLDSNTINQPVVGFVLNNAGLAAGVSLQGSKVQPIDL